MKSLVYVAMSGGVDSSVTAALLQKKNYRVVGVFFKPWSPPLKSPHRGDIGGFCNWQQDRLDALRVAAQLGIEFKTWDFSQAYGKKVAQYMIDGYRAGITPNPDVMCNKEIKFGLFLEKALAEGADYIATGHYAITKNNKLYKAKDKNKDQTYFLWTLTQNQLKHCLFPIGEYTKPEVRKLAKRFGLPNHAKKDSQGVCFVGELAMKDFLKKYITQKPGEIRLGDAVVGRHEGASYYTIGQRHGLNITDGGGPYYVALKDMKKNIIYVSNNELRIMSNDLKFGNSNWIGQTPVFPLKADVQIRYRTPPNPSKVTIHDSLFIIHSRKPFMAVAEGQSAVIYRGQEVLGGGILRSSLEVSESP